MSWARETQCTSETASSATHIRRVDGWEHEFECQLRRWIYGRQVGIGMLFCWILMSAGLREVLGSALVLCCSRELVAGWLVGEAKQGRDPFFRAQQGPSGKW